MDDSRRGFLKKAGCAAVAGSGLPLLSAGCNSGHDTGDAANSEVQWAMVIDLPKWQSLTDADRENCMVACRQAHNVPKIDEPNQKIEWIWEENYEHVFPDQVNEPLKEALVETPLPVPVLCNHCKNPPCVKVCPTQATWKRASDGVVMMDMHRCIGCRYCMAACPYGARSFNFGDPRKKDKEGKERIETDENGKFLTDYPTRTKGVVEKCTFCTERIRAAGKDEEVIPACVEVANAAAKEAGEDEDVMTFGKLTDAKIKSILETKRTICRRVALGTGPNVYYVADGLKIG